MYMYVIYCVKHLTFQNSPKMTGAKLKKNKTKTDRPYFVTNCS